jgi:uncharacterized protein (TIGR03437 family)
LISAADPAFKTVNGLGTGQVLATNFDDGTLNGPQHPVGLGKILTLALTGQGLVNNPPADGNPPPAGTLLPTSELPVVTMAVNIPNERILFPGLIRPTRVLDVIIKIPMSPERTAAEQYSDLVRFHDIRNWGFDPSSTIATPC